jgi:predicted alpha/beta hydrolase family esterase
MTDTYILHGRGSSPKKTFIPWLSDELGQRGYKSLAPKMPQPNFPRFKEWYNALDRLIVDEGQPRTLVGHSAASHIILHYTADMQISTEGIYLVAPFQELNLAGIYKKTEDALQNKPLPGFIKSAIRQLSVINSKSWCRRELPWDRIKDYQSVLHLYFSEDDYIVPKSQIDVFYKNLPLADIVVEKDKGHFDTASSTTHYNRLLEDILCVLNCNR